MTTPHGQPLFTARDNAHVVQGQHVHIDQLTIGDDADREAQYQVGVNNLNSGNAVAAREYIWKAMMRDLRNSRVLFHWLVAMLTGRTVRQFSKLEIEQLRKCRSWHGGAGDDEWSDGVRLIYRLLDSVVQPSGTRAPSKADASLLDKQFDNLGRRQRRMLAGLDLFLSGPRKDELWRDELQTAKSQQLSKGRVSRAWKFFHPNPVQVVLPEPYLERVTRAQLWSMRFTMSLSTVLAGYVSLTLIGHDAFGLIGCLVALMGGIVAAEADLELRVPAERFLVPAQPPDLPDDELARQPATGFAELTKKIDTLFQRYLDRYEPDEATRKILGGAPRQLRRNEVIGICRRNGFSAADVAWLIRHEVHDLRRQSRNGTLPTTQPVPGRGVVAARKAGLAVLIVGCFFGCAVTTLMALPHVIGVAGAMASAFWAWRCWRPVSLERRRYAADKRERDRRQAGIDAAYRKWCDKMKGRPKDAQIAKWLEHDRTVLMGMALDYFTLPRSSLIAHGFLEKPGTAAKRQQDEGGIVRYHKYQIWMFLLTDDGVRQMRASLDFWTGTLVLREHISYGYDSIAAVHVQKVRGRETFELRLTGGEPIKVQLGESPQNDKQDEKGDSPDEETGDAPDGTELDEANVINTLHVLDGVAAEGRKWLEEHKWSRAWQDDQAV